MEGEYPTKVSSQKSLVLQPKRNTSDIVIIYRLGLTEIKIHDELYKNHNITAMSGIVSVSPNKAFKIIVENYGNGSYSLNRNQTVENILLKPGAVAPNYVILLEVLCVDKVSSYEK